MLPAPAAAQPVPVDHFWCYTAAGQASDAPVILRDQFDPAGAAPQAFGVRNPVRFCNPVAKTTAAGVTTPITNRTSHLEMDLIFGGRLEDPRRVTVRNQFGRQTLYTFDPVLLAVPSGKNTEGEADNLDHFKCYRAYGPRVRNRVVRLEDQFQEGTATVLRAVTFCNPVVKQHGAVTIPIENKDAHLVCYQTTPVALTTPRVLLSRNQFGNKDLLVGIANLLCVPSQKLRFAPLF
jgi:hypothetical protein